MDNELNQIIKVLLSIYNNIYMSAEENMILYGDNNILRKFEVIDKRFKNAITTSCNKQYIQEVLQSVILDSTMLMTTELFTILAKEDTNTNDL